MKLYPTAASRWRSGGRSKDSAWIGGEDSLLIGGEEDEEVGGVE